MDDKKKSTIYKSKTNGIEMQHKTISLPLTTWKRVDKQSVKLGISKVEVIRRTLDLNLPKLSGGQKKK